MRGRPAGAPGLERGAHAAHLPRLRRPRRSRINADVGQPVKPGTLLAQLASPDFGIAQADTAKAQADARLHARSAAAPARAVRGRHHRPQGPGAGRGRRRPLAGRDPRARSPHHAVRRRVPASNQQLALIAGHHRRGGRAQPQPRPGTAARPGRPGHAAAVRGERPHLAVGADRRARDPTSARLRPGAAFELTCRRCPGEKFEGKVIGGRPTSSTRPRAPSRSAAWSPTPTAGSRPRCWPRRASSAVARSRRGGAGHGRDAARHASIRSWCRRSPASSSRAT